MLSITFLVFLGMAIKTLNMVRGDSNANLGVAKGDNNTHTSMAMNIQVQ